MNCGCGDFRRCADHAAKMQVIHDAWYNGSDEDGRVIWALQDGYGVAGYTPIQGFDWSGIRDSSTSAVDRMYEEITRGEQ